MSPGQLLCNVRDGDRKPGHDEIKENAKVFYMIKYPTSTFQFEFLEKMRCEGRAGDADEVLCKAQRPLHHLALAAFQTSPEGSYAFHSFVAVSDPGHEPARPEESTTDCACPNFDFPSAWCSLRVNLRRKIGEDEYELVRSEVVSSPELGCGSVLEDENHSLRVLREAVKETVLVWLSEAGTLEPPAVLAVTTPPMSFVDGCAVEFVGEVHKHHDGRSYCVAEGNGKSTRVAALQDLLDVVEKLRVETMTAPTKRA